LYQKEDSLERLIEQYKQQMKQYTYTPPEAAPVQATVPPAPAAEEGLDDVGRLQIRVETGDSALPIGGVTVVISRADGERELLERILRTDFDGQTEVIELPTYNRIESESPDGAAAKYTTYNLYVDQAGYYPTRSLGVPIFGGVTSTQTFELRPLPEFYVGDTLNVIENTEPNLM
jgi:hypothetical protein